MSGKMVKAAGLVLLLSGLGACTGTTGGYTRPGELVGTDEFVKNVLEEKGVVRGVSSRTTGGTSVGQPMS
jgi:hypothetical protein